VIKQLYQTIIRHACFSYVGSTSQARKALSAKLMPEKSHERRNTGEQTEFRPESIGSR
jgi:hypothetical protein